MFSKRNAITRAAERNYRAKGFNISQILETKIARADSYLRFPPYRKTGEREGKMDFAARLRIAIFQKGKTQKWLAKTIGVAEQTVSRWCNDDKVPNLNVISAICDALDVSADWLIRGKNESV